MPGFTRCLVCPVALFCAGTTLAAVWQLPHRARRPCHLLPPKVLFKVHLPISVCFQFIDHTFLLMSATHLMALAVCEHGTSPEVICADPNHPCNKQYGEICSLDEHNVCCPYLGKSALECGDNLCVPYCDACNAAAALAPMSLVPSHPPMEHAMSQPLRQYHPLQVR